MNKQLSAKDIFLRTMLYLVISIICLEVHY